MESLKCSFTLAPSHNKHGSALHTEQLQLICLGLEDSIFLLVSKYGAEHEKTTYYKMWADGFLMQLITNRYFSAIQMLFQGDQVTASEISGTITLQLGNATQKLAHYFSLMQVRKALLLDIVQYCEHYDKKTVNCAFEFLLAHPDDYPDEASGAAHIVICNIEDFPHLLGKATKFAIGPKCKYDKELLITTTDIVLSKVKTWGGTSIDNIARQVFHLKENHQPDQVIAACIHIMMFSENFTDKLIQQVSAHIENNILAFPIPVQAHVFVLKNLSFFSTPLEDQKEFVDYYRDNSRYFLLKEYSDGLEKKLKEDDQLVSYQVVEKGTTNVYDVPLSHYDLWLIAQVLEVLYLNIEVCDYLLENKEHDAVRWWKTRDKSKECSG